MMIPKFMRVLLEYEMNYLIFHTEKPTDERTLLGLLLIKHQYHKVLFWLVHVMGRDSVVGIATRYRVGGLGIKSRWVRDFPHLSRPALVAIHPPIQWVLGLSRG
jgi:hypothetical protein